MTPKPDVTEVPIGLDGHLDMADGGHIGLRIYDIEVVDLMRTKFCWCQKDNVLVNSEAALHGFYILLRYKITLVWHDQKA